MTPSAALLLWQSVYMFEHMESTCVPLYGPSPLFAYLVWRVTSGKSRLAAVAV
jgi:hypothetical protein